MPLPATAPTPDADASAPDELKLADALPVLTGRLDATLCRRWRTLAPETMATICAMETFEQALVATVQHLQGATAFVHPNPYEAYATRVVWLLDDTVDVLTKVSPLDRTPEAGQRGLIAEMTFRDEDAEDWLSYADDPRIGNRCDLINMILFQSRVSAYTLTECLHAATLRFPRWRVDLVGGLHLWWTRALAQGHSVASARTLLGLLADPVTLSHVTAWPTEDDPMALVVEAKVVVPQV